MVGCEVPGERPPITVVRSKFNVYFKSFSIAGISFRNIMSPQSGAPDSLCMFH